MTGKTGIQTEFFEITREKDSSSIKEVDLYFRDYRQKAEDYIAAGVRKGHARGLAAMEMRIAQWPSAWGEDFLVLIYGDFNPPTTKLEFPDLGITIEPDKIVNSVIRSAICVLKARVKIPEKSLQALAEASRRVDTLLGVLVALGWANSSMGWWSYITHGEVAGIHLNLEPDKVTEVVAALERLPEPVARRVRSALYWIREPRHLVMEGYRSDVLRLYAGYWNAFECLVDAVCILRPEPKLGRAEKQTLINKFVEEREGKLNANAISECYKKFVDPGFVAKAEHALKICFPDLAEKYFVECFRMNPEQDRLYNIRNAINHGDVDASNPNELLRIEDRQLKLWMIVFGMLGLIIPIPRPLDQEYRT